MQSAYPHDPNAAKTNVRAMRTALPDARDVAAATGTAAQRKYPLGIGAAARAETENIGRTVATFLRGKARL